MKSFYFFFLSILIVNTSLSQSYEQRLQMTQNKKTPFAKDIRYLLSYSDGNKTDDQLIEMLETIKISDGEKRKVSAEVAFTLNRYKLAKYMIENGYQMPGNLSSMFNKPFSDGARNKMRPSKQQYTIAETKDYMKLFVNKGMRVDANCITRLEQRNATELKAYAFEIMSDEDLKTYHMLIIEMILRQQKPDFAKVDSVLAISDFNFGGNYLAKQYNASLQVIKEIRLRGGNINSVNNQGETLLMLVIRRGRPEVVQYLLNENKTNICAKNNIGENALYYLKKKVSSRISKSSSYKSLIKQLKTMDCK